MDIVATLLPAVEHLGKASYWVIFLISFVEAVAFIGELVPGALSVIMFGLLASKGHLDFGDLVWFVAVGAILGDILSYWLGSKGTQLFQKNSRIFKKSHLLYGEQFFEKYGYKSVLLGRFVGPLRPIIPFVAGMFRMPIRKFIFWNVLSGFLWAAGYLALGYFFGGAARVIEQWMSRIGLVIVVGIVIAAAVILLRRRNKIIEQNVHDVS